MLEKGLKGVWSPYLFLSLSLCAIVPDISYHWVELFLFLRNLPSLFYPIPLCVNVAASSLTKAANGSAVE